MFVLVGTRGASCDRAGAVRLAMRARLAVTGPRLAVRRTINAGMSVSISNARVPGAFRRVPVFRRARISLRRRSRDGNLKWLLLSNVH